MKKQTKEIIKFRKQYLFLLQELINDAGFFKKQYSNICVIDNSIFSKKVKKNIQASFVNSNIDFINIDSIDSIAEKKYDLILAPFALQFFNNIEYSLSKISDFLNYDGILLATGFNILQASSSIEAFKQYIIANKLNSKYIDSFNLSELLKKYRFASNTLDRDVFIISGSKVEILNLYCRKKEQNSLNNSIKIVIN